MRDLYVNRLSRRDFLRLALAATARIFVPSCQLGEELALGCGRRLRVDEGNYLADTNDEAIWVARKINFIPNREYEHPSNMCGPLAAAIMKDSGFYPASLDLNPSSFWLADPDRLNNLLPGQIFEHCHIPVSTKNYDFNANPLEIGDFLFLHGGTFGHMIVVFEIDYFGCAYAISNINNGNGQYTIEKILLYDPLNNSVGFFKDNWARRGSVNGTTGVAFDIWRLKNEFVHQCYR